MLNNFSFLQKFYNNYSYARGGHEKNQSIYIFPIRYRIRAFNCYNSFKQTQQKIQRTFRDRGDILESSAGDHFQGQIKDPSTADIWASYTTKRDLCKKVFKILNTFKNYYPLHPLLIWAVSIAWTSPLYLATSPS